MRFSFLAISSILFGVAWTSQAFGEVTIKRVVSVPAGAEVTGLMLSENDLFLNYQHPNKSNKTPFNIAAIGVISNIDLSSPLNVPNGDVVETLTSSIGTWQRILSAGQDGMGVIDGKTSNKPDFNSFIPINENQGYLFTNWEERPGGMSRVKLTRMDDGSYKVNEAKMIDFSSVNGTWVNCFGTTSPWQTPLSSEELYFDNTSDWNNSGYKSHKDILALQKHLNGKFPNPYDYGYIVEIKDPKEVPKPIKHFAMGRFSHENAVVMPDDKTVYLSDDGTNVVFFKFIADIEGDLSSGTLYAANFSQIGEPGISVTDASFDIEWIELAHGKNEEIMEWVREYDDITPKDFGSEKTYITDLEIKNWANGKASDDRVAFLESRKAAAAKGATAEFRKMEGVNINYNAAKDGSHPFIYLAMSNINKAMSDDQGDIQLAENPCGAVFQMELDEDFNVSKMTSFIEGGPYSKAFAPNFCDVNNISEPDNLIVLNDGSVLIGEDTNEHQNNFLWLAKSVPILQSN